MEKVTELRETDSDVSPAAAPPAPPKRERKPRVKAQEDVSTAPDVAENADQPIEDEEPVVEQPEPAPAPARSSGARPPRGSLADLRNVTTAPRPTGTTELRRIPRPPSGAAPSSAPVAPPRPPPQAAPPPQPPTPATPSAPSTPVNEEQGVYIKRLVEACLAYGVEHMAHPSAAVVVDCGQRLGALLR